MRRPIGLIVLTLVAFFPFMAGVAAEDPQWEEIFFRSNQAYKEGRFQEAINGYGHLIQSGQRTGHLFYNLGNACFRLEQLGPAILNFERARLLMPRDADLSFNLRHARDQIQDAIPDSQGLISSTFFWLDSLSLNDLFLGFAIVNILFWAILLIRLFFRSEWSYYLLLVVLIFWVIAGASFGLKWYQVGTDDRAVILTEEVDVLAGPDIQDTVLFKLHAGAIVHHERSEDGWSLIRLPDKKRGWVKRESVERIQYMQTLKSGSLSPALRKTYSSYSAVSSISVKLTPCSLKRFQAV
ncbi:MAG: SH3 domain-containing protein [Proteobacteria bacterium]|nr:SH3 domain-containing protein [Pseudomonadota bacterium]